MGDAGSRFEDLVRSWASKLAEERHLNVAELDRVDGLGPRLEEAVLRGIDNGLVVVGDSGTFRIHRDPRDRELNFLSAMDIGPGASGPSRPSLNWEWFVKVAAYVELVEAGWSRRALDLQPTDLVDVMVTRPDESVPLIVEARWSGDELRRSLARLRELSFERWREPKDRDGRKFKHWTDDHAAEYLWAFAPDHDEVLEFDYAHPVPRLVPSEVPPPE